MQYNDIIPEMMNLCFRRLAMPAHAQTQAARIFVYYNDQAGTYDSLSGAGAKAYLRTLCKTREPQRFDKETPRTWKFDASMCIRRTGKRFIDSKTGVQDIEVFVP